jgi:hypothetical protein
MELQEPVYLNAAETKSDHATAVLPATISPVPWPRCT